MDGVWRTGWVGVSGGQVRGLFRNKPLPDRLKTAERNVIMGAGPKLPLL